MRTATPATPSRPPASRCSCSRPTPASYPPLSKVTTSSPEAHLTERNSALGEGWLDVHEKPAAEQVPV